MAPRTLSLVLLGACAHFASSHPMCLENAVPTLDVAIGTSDYRKTNNPNRQPFCTLNVMRQGGELVLDDGTCCNLDRDRAILKIFNSDMTSFGIVPNTSLCYNYHASLLCSECHPFAGHLYLANDTKQQVDMSLGGVALINNTFLTKWVKACSTVAPGLVSKYYVPPTKQGLIKRIKGVDGLGTDGGFAFPYDPVWYWGTGGSGIPPTATFKGLTMPHHAMQMRMRPDSNYWWMVQKYGELWEFENVASVSTKTMILDLTNKVLESNSEGMLDVSFDPDFENNKVFYIYYTYLYNPTVNGNVLNEVAPFQLYPAKEGQSHYGRLARFQLKETPALTRATEISVFDVYQTDLIHKAGAMAWYKGELYMAHGDGGGNNDQYGSAQDINTVRGKILRMKINPMTGEYTGTGVPGTAGNMVLAKGIRNPHKMTIDQVTGEIWWGEVGQADREEVNMIKADPSRVQNMGWPYWEGNRCNVDAFNTANFNPTCSGLAYSSIVPPVFDWCHVMNKPMTQWDKGPCYPNYTGSAAIGGYVYRGSRWPNLYGNYVYLDYRNSESGVIVMDANRNFVKRVHLQPLGMNVASMAMDKDGELYYLSHQDLPVTVNGNAYNRTATVLPLNNCGSLPTEFCYVAETAAPTAAPTAPATTAAPTFAATAKPTWAPSFAPTTEPTPEHTSAPTPEPTSASTPEPSRAPTPEPTSAPTPELSRAPTPEPTSAPTPEPASAPTPEPSRAPTPEPTLAPTPEPTSAPTHAPAPTKKPVTRKPAVPTNKPTRSPTKPKTKKTPPPAGNRLRK